MCCEGGAAVQAPLRAAPLPGPAARRGARGARRRRRGAAARRAARRAAALRRVPRRARRARARAAVRRDVRPAPPREPLPHLLRPRRHAQARDGAAAPEASVRRRRARARGRRAARLPAARARVRGARARGRRRGAPARASPRARAAARRPPGRRQSLRRRPRRALRRPAASERARARARATHRRARAAGRAGRAAAVRAARGDAGGGARVSHRAHLYVWLVLPYVSLAIFVVGHWWRYRRDQFGWTSRSSQLLESRLLAWGSTMFHYGALAVIAGHVVGVLVPASVTRALGISERSYHHLAGIGGGIAGLVCLAGFGILTFRRTRIRRVRATTSYQLHAAIPWLLYAVWPFSRLVHAWSYPLQYLGRPYILYRSRRPAAARSG